MNKTDIVNAVAADTGVSKSKVQSMLESALEAITKAVDGGDKVVFKGFGVFKPRTQKARTARNPRTGEAVAVPEKQKMVFAASKA